MHTNIKKTVADTVLRFAMDIETQDDLSFEVVCWDGKIAKQLYNELDPLFIENDLKGITVIQERSSLFFNFLDNIHAQDSILPIKMFYEGLEDAEDKIDGTFAANDSAVETKEIPTFDGDTQPVLRVVDKDNAAIYSPDNPDLYQKFLEPLITHIHFFASKGNTVIMHTKDAKDQMKLQRLLEGFKGININSELPNDITGISVTFDERLLNKNIVSHDAPYLPDLYLLTALESIEHKRSL